MIPVYRPYLDERERRYVLECLDSTWISSKGSFIGKFEDAFAQYIGVDYATSVCNGTVALHLALESLGIGEGDEVIVPTLTYIASVNAIIQTGATPIFADSEFKSWNLDAADVRRRITPRTKGVMAVHLYGLPCDMDGLSQVCSEYGIHLIEDCAEAFGTKYKGRHVGTFGDVGTFSFFGNKTITTGEGGMVVTRSADLHERAAHLKNQGVSSSREYWHESVAYNYRMTNLCAAIGLAQLEKADEILLKKRAIAQWYETGLAGVPLKFHKELPGTTHSFWMCSVLVEAPVRERLRQMLAEHDIETRPVFFPAHVMPNWETGESFPIAEELGARGINLPSYPALQRADVAKICALIKAFFANE